RAGITGPHLAVRRGRCPWVTPSCRVRPSPRTRQLERPNPRSTRPVSKLTSRWLIDIPGGVLGGENRVSQGRRERQYLNVLARPRTPRDDVFAAAAAPAASW